MIVRLKKNRRAQRETVANNLTIDPERRKTAKEVKFDKKKKTKWGEVGWYVSGLFKIRSKEGLYEEDGGDL